MARRGAEDGNVRHEYTVLDRALAALRARAADRLIPRHLRGGAVLDVGCGVRPVFLERTTFAHKVGVDHYLPDAGRDGVRFVACDLDRALLPFDTGTFDAVTMLAVIEHVSPARRVALVDEIHRLLRPGGVVVVTTPPPWTDALHDLLLRTRLIGSYMAEGHGETFTARDLAGVFARSRFGRSSLRLGYFEMFMNMWAVARKPLREEKHLGTARRGADRIG